MPVPLRVDFDAVVVRALAKKSKDAGAAIAGCGGDL
jgi:hypothetical protein